MFKIFMVEDDETIAGIILENLIKSGYSGMVAKQLNDIMPEFIEYKPDLVLLDIILPFFNGYYWCSQIRMHSKVPICFISSKSEDMDIVIATNMGGDEYLIKPFSMDVLLAKVSGLLRRTYSYDNSAMEMISYKDMIFNISSGIVSAFGDTVELTKNEAQIFALLLRNRGSIVSRERIIRTLWKNASFIDDNTLTVNMTRLRRKLNDIGLENFIKTKKNSGYMV